MRSFSTALLILVLLPVVNLVLSQESEVPRVIQYQGQLMFDGEPATGTEQVAFELQREDGSQISSWQEEHHVVTERGLFEVRLGEQTPLPMEAFESEEAVYLAVMVGGETARMRLVSTPFALRAAAADEALVARQVQSGGVTQEAMAEGAAVHSLNELTEAVELVAGSNVTISTDSGDGTIQISAEGPDGGLASVATDNSLEGDGTSGSPLGLAEGAAVQSLNGLTDEVSLEGNNIDIDVSGQTITLSAAEPADGGLTSVATDNSLDGNGTSDSPLGLAEGSVGESELADGTAVRSLEGLTDEISLDEGDNISIDASGQTITISASNDELSSRRFKENIVPLEEAISLVQQLEGVRYTWVDEGRQDVGLIAEEVAEVLPEVISYEEDGTTVRGINYGKLVSVLVEATKDQQETIERQQGQIDALKQQMERLEAVVQQVAAGEPGQNNQ